MNPEARLSRARSMQAPPSHRGGHPREAPYIKTELATAGSQGRVKYSHGPISTGTKTVVLRRHVSEYRREG
ncbi:hypothetical protein GGTG_09915 [Gaeumannomyces tritici R3-111a-1]|uniref:Uncharacterized protein n=1 Tax=Gaeumannomyces tritici (strain R3-111a-1) TaxID=644352 RepID=J3P8T0_GAET3|nr:hypothetical protein GGTG_09915 [Gaeumannomyces tritici R3-111a-1]EJT73064.1 hypothetical protein GGTG_09915 [Gaeumannomyces tritici R3-111a-1]